MALGEPDPGEEAKPPPALADRDAANPPSQIYDASGLPSNVMKVEVSAMSTYQGPIPPPAYLRGFEEVVPGSAARILAMAEKAQRHSQLMNTGASIYAHTALFFGFLSLLVVICASTYLAMHDKTVVASLLPGVPVVGAIGWFVRARLSASDTESSAPTTPDSSPPASP